MPPELRTNNFNLLRLLFAYLVILSHSYPLTAHADREPLLRLSGGQATLGTVAVTAFFMISGFLITRSWVGSRSLLQFLIKRVRRIYPAFILATLLALVFFAPIGANGPAYWHSVRWIRLISTTFCLLPSLPPTFTTLPVHGLNGAIWSIPWEFACYLAVPLAAAIGILRHRRFALVAFALLMIAFAIKTYLHPTLPFPGRILTAFAAGQIFYLYRHEIPYRAAYFLAALLLVIASILLPRLKLFELLIPIFGAYVLFYAAFARARFLDTIKKPLETFDISYGVYLYGWPVQQLVVLKLGTKFDQLGLLTLALVGSTVLGALSWVLVEKPFLRNRASHQIAVEGPRHDLIEPAPST